MARGYLVTERDAAVIRAALDKLRRQPVNVPRHALVEEPPQAPEVYVALTPVLGVPALTSNVPGSRDCDIYRIVMTGATPGLIDTGLSKTVYNISESPVGGSEWIMIERDKFGHWYATGLAGDGGSSSGGDSPDIWANCYITSSVSRVLCHENLPIVTRIAAGMFLCTMDVDFGTPDAFTPRGTVGNNDYFYEVEQYRTDSSFVMQTGSGTDPSGSFGFAVHGCIGCCEPYGTGTGTGSGTGTGTGVGECELWPYTNCTQFGTTTGTTWYISFANFCIHDTQKKLYMVFSSGPDDLTSLGVIPLCYDATTGGWDNYAIFTICGQPVFQMHFFAPGGITSNVVEIPSSPNPFLSVVQCDPLIMQGIVNTECGDQALLTVMEEFPYQPYCGGAIEPGTGTGTGTGTGGGEISTLCCPANDLPETLHVTITGKSGSCTCLPDSLTLVWDGSFWESASWTECGGSTVLRLRCSNLPESCSGFQLTMFGNCTISPSNPTSCSCSPLSLTFSPVGVGTCCLGSATFTVTE